MLYRGVRNFWGQVPQDHKDRVHTLHDAPGQGYLAPAPTIITVRRNNWHEHHCPWDARTTEEFAQYKAKRRYDRWHEGIAWSSASESEFRNHERAVRFRAEAPRYERVKRTQYGLPLFILSVVLLVPYFYVSNVGTDMQYGGIAFGVSAIIGSLAALAAWAMMRLWVRSPLGMMGVVAALAVFGLVRHPRPVDNWSERMSDEDYRVKF